MPKLPPKICKEPGCFAPARHPAKYCPRHREKHGAWSDKGSRWSKKSRHERGYGTEWDRLRNIVLGRDMHLCQVCLAAGVYRPGSQVDHIKPKSQGGTDDIENLQSICKECHKEKTNRESTDWRK